MKILIIMLLKWSVVFEKMDTLAILPEELIYTPVYHSIPFELKAGNNYYILWDFSESLLEYDVVPKFYLFKEIEYYKWKAKEEDFNYEIWGISRKGAFEYKPPISSKYIGVLELTPIYLPDTLNLFYSYLQVIIIKSDSLLPTFEVENEKDIKWICKMVFGSSEGFIYKGPREDTLIVTCFSKASASLHIQQRGGWVKMTDFEPSYEFRILLNPGEKLVISPVEESSSETFGYMVRTKGFDKIVRKILMKK